MSKFKGKVAVVTGAASGIGRALALDLAGRGAKLALSDVNAEGLEETAKLARDKGAEVHTQLLDVGDEAAVNAYAKAVKAHFGVVHQLYNNAGITRGSREFVDMNPADFDGIMRVNFFGVLYGTRAFLPFLIESGDGAVVNISSLNGLMAQPGLTAYCSSKFAVRGFTEALRSEMIVYGQKVQVVAVHPGGVRTNIANAAIPSEGEVSSEEMEIAKKRARFYNKKLLKMPAEKAAKIILNGVARGRNRIVITTLAILIDYLVRLLPSSYVGIVARESKKQMRQAGLMHKKPAA